ncbi:MAG: hypothetical protein R3208_04315 [Ketobacteraceae bacterium]|nr:hypothetical protein [Ketobacteraceae bacterium]
MTDPVNVFCALLMTAALALTIPVAGAAESGLDSELGLQGRFFTEDSPLQSKDVTGALRYRMEYYRRWNDGADTFEFVPWFIWDSEDEERRHGDIQDMAWLHVTRDYELRVGIRKVFWGKTESQHRVDIINQTDLAVHPDGEEKLGQPMVNLSLVRDWGILDLFVMTGHRERIYPGESGRFRVATLPVDWDDSEYAHPDEEMLVEFAARWQHYYGSWEWAVSHFSGNSRQPILQVERGPDGPERLVPLYHTIDQTGLELQYIWGSWIFKGEFISNSGFEDRYTAGTLGFEYTQVGILDTVYDFGWILEYSADDRGDRARSVAEHDVFLGGRLSFNDMDSSEVLMGVNLDIETDEQLYVLEASQRIGESLKLFIDAFVITGSEGPPPFGEFDTEYKTATFSKDDYIQLELVYYF